jgi:hypothetical protein
MAIVTFLLYIVQNQSTQMFQNQKKKIKFKYFLGIQFVIKCYLFVLMLQYVT